MAQPPTDLVPPLSDVRARSASPHAPSASSHEPSQARTNPTGRSTLPPRGNSAPTRRSEGTREKSAIKSTGNRIFAPRSASAKHQRALFPTVHVPSGDSAPVPRTHLEDTADVWDIDEVLDFTGEPDSACHLTIPGIAPMMLSLQCTCPARDACAGPECVSLPLSFADDHGDLFDHDVLDMKEWDAGTATGGTRRYSPAHPRPGHSAEMADAKSHAPPPPATRRLRPPSARPAAAPTDPLSHTPRQGLAGPRPASASGGGGGGDAGDATEAAGLGDMQVHPLLSLMRAGFDGSSARIAARIASGRERGVGAAPPRHACPERISELAAPKQPPRGRRKGRDGADRAEAEVRTPVIYAHATSSRVLRRQELHRGVS